MQFILPIGLNASLRQYIVYDDLWTVKFCRPSVVQVNISDKAGKM